MKPKPRPPRKPRSRVASACGWCGSWATKDRTRRPLTRLPTTAPPPTPSLTAPSRARRRCQALLCRSPPLCCRPGFGCDARTMQYPDGVSDISDPRGDLQWGTIPGLVEDAAARFGGAEAIVDVHGPGGTTVRLTFDQLADEVASASRAIVANGIDRGDRVAIWAPNCVEWVDRCSGCPRRRCFAGPAQHPVQGGRSRLHPARRPGRAYCSLSRDSWATTIRPCSTKRWRAATRFPISSGWSSSARATTAPPAHGQGRPGGDLGCLPPGGGRVLGRRGRRPHRLHHAGRPLRSGVHLGDHWAAQGGHDHPRSDTAHLCHMVRGSRVAPGRPLSHRQSLLPYLRLQSRHPGLPDDRGHHGARARLRRGPGPPTHRGGAHHRCCPGHPPSSSRCSTTPNARASTCPRSGWWSPGRPPCPSRWCGRCGRTWASRRY